jgi:2-methylisocitrate lyase-like PEP mutase family enzyme
MLSTAARSTISTPARAAKRLDLPVNALLLPHGPTVADLTALGVRRISVGGTFAYAAIGSLVEAGRELLAGSANFFDRAAVGRSAVEEAFR